MLAFINGLEIKKTYSVKYEHSIRYSDSDPFKAPSDGIRPYAVGSLDNPHLLNIGNGAYQSAVEHASGRLVRYLGLHQMDGIDATLRNTAGIRRLAVYW